MVNNLLSVSFVFGMSLATVVDLSGKFFYENNFLKSLYIDQYCIGWLLILAIGSAQLTDLNVNFSQLQTHLNSFF